MSEPQVSNHCPDCAGLSERIERLERAVRLLIEAQNNPDWRASVPVATAALRSLDGDAPTPPPEPTNEHDAHYGRTKHDWSTCGACDTPCSVMDPCKCCQAYPPPEMPPLPDVIHTLPDGCDDFTTDEVKDYANAYARRCVEAATAGLEMRVQVALKAKRTAEQERRLDQERIAELERDFKRAREGAAEAIYTAREEASKAASERVLREVRRWISELPTIEPMTKPAFYETCVRLAEIKKLDAKLRGEG